MVELFGRRYGVRGARRYLDHLQNGIRLRMDGAESLALNCAYRHALCGCRTVPCWESVG